MRRSLRYKALLTGLITALSIVPLSAETVELTLQDAIDRALTHNSTLASSAISLESARRTYENSWNVFLPTVSAGVTASYSKSTTLFENDTATTSSMGSFGGTGSSSTSPFSVTPKVQESLSIDATIPNTLKQNALQYEQQLLSYKKQLVQTEQQTASKYYNLIAAQENIAILENSLALASASLADTLASYRAGTANELEYLQAQYSEHSIVPQIAQAKTQYESDLNSFKIFLGYSTDDDITLTGDIAVTTLNLPAGDALSQLIETRYKERLDVQLQELQVQNAELSLSSTKIRTYLPVSLTESISASPKDSQDYSKGISVTASISAGISLNLTGFIPGSSTQLNLQKAEDSVTTAQMSLETTETSAKQSIASAVENLRLQAQTLALNEESLAISRRQYALTQESYRNGLTSVSQLDETRQRLQQSQQTVLKGQISYLTCVYTLAGELNMSVEELYELFK